MKNSRLLHWISVAVLLFPLFAEAQTLTYGTAVQFQNSNPQMSTVAKIDATHSMLVYGSSSTNKGYARVVTVSGSTVTLGTQYQYSATYAAMMNVTVLDSTHAVIVYDDYNSSSTTKLLIATISGSSLSFGSAVSLTSNTNVGIGYGYGIAKLDSTHFALAYGTYIAGDFMFGEPDTYAGYVVVGSVSGTTITLGSSQTFTASNPGALSLAALDSTHFVFASSGISKVQAASVSGTSVTLGTAVSINAGVPFLGNIDATHFLLSTVASAEYARIGSVSGTSITLGSAVNYANTSASYGATVILDSTHANLYYKNLAMPVAMSGTTVTAGTATTFDSSSFQHLMFAAALSSGSVIIGETGDDNTGYVFAGRDITALSAPSGFTASQQGSNVLLSWTNPTDDNDLSSVTVRRSTSGYPSTITGGSSVTSGTSTSYTDSSLSDGAYYYSIFATDISGNISTAAHASVTVDTVAPTVASFSPGDGHTDVHTDSNFVLTFNETMGASGTGTISIYKSSDNSLVERMSAAGGNVTGSGTTQITINPSADLDTDSAYYILISPNALRDAAHNDFAGISSAILWNFATVETAASSSSSSSSSSVRSQSVGGGGGRSGGGDSATAARSTTAPTSTLHLAADASHNSPASNSAAPAHAPANPTAGVAPVAKMLDGLQTRLETRIQQQITANPKLAPILSKMLTRMNQRIAKLNGR